MLSAGDAIEFPAGVRLEGTCVVDDVRGARWPANPSARRVLARAGSPLADVAADLAATHALDTLRARDDVLAFAWALNRALLVNVRPAGGRIARGRFLLGLAVRLAPSGRLPQTAARRCPLDTSTMPRAFVGTVAAAAPRGVLVTCLAALAAGMAGLLAAAPVPVVLLAAACGLGLMLHEAGHAAALGRLPAALVVAGPRTFVLHPTLPSRRRAVVACAGPGAAAAAGVATAALAVLVDAPSAAALAAPLAAHGVALTVAASDGRRACGL